MGKCCLGMEFFFLRTKRKLNPLHLSKYATQRAHLSFPVLGKNFRDIDTNQLKWREWRLKEGHKCCTEHQFHEVMRLFVWENKPKYVTQWTVCVRDWDVRIPVRSRPDCVILSSVCFGSCQIRNLISITCVQLCQMRHEIALKLVAPRRLHTSIHHPVKPSP